MSVVRLYVELLLDSFGFEANLQQTDVVTVTILLLEEAEHRLALIAHLAKGNTVECCHAVLFHRSPQATNADGKQRGWSKYRGSG